MSAAWTFKLPDVGEGIPEAELIEWHVEVGDEVAEGDPLAEVMTDKATVELPSPVTGTVEWLGAETGDMVPVGAELVRFDTESTPARAPASSGSAPSSGPESATTPAPPPRERVGADPFAVGDPGQSAGHPPAPASQTPPQDPAARRNGAVLAAPVVRRRARELGIDLHGIAGSGPEGRVTHEDLDRHLVDGAGDGSRRGVGGSGPPAREGVERVELRGLRRSIARHMQVASERIPHFTYVDEVDVTELQRLRPALDRERQRDDATAGHRTGVLEFVMRAVVLAVEDHPEMNARFDDDAGVVERHAAVHLGVAVQTPDGLVVTVLRHAETRGLRDCATEVERLAASARSGRAPLEELSGSTITISSLGASGGVVSTPIVNHPEVAIVGVNKIAERPVVRDGTVVVRQMMNLSCSFDHRVVDGWDAARFVQRCRELLETPALLLAR